MTARSVQTRRGRFGVTSTGVGQPLVLCHSLAMSGKMWARSTTFLADRFEVWTIDARGHGSSSWDGRPFTIDDMAEDTVAVLDALGLTEVHLLGLSMGGSTALTVAARHPERIATLTAVDTTASYGPGRTETWSERARSAAASTRDELLPFQLSRWFTPSFLTAQPDVVDEIADVFRATDPRVHAAACMALGELDIEPELAHIDAPTLVLVGSEDYATPPAMARAIAAGVSGSTLVELPGLRHMSVIEDPGVWVRVAAHLSAG